MLSLLLGVSVFISNPADNGVRNVRVEFEGWPRVVLGRGPEDVVREDYTLDLGEAFTFYAAGSFVGLDRGDVGEFDVQVGCADGPIFYARSLHKETAAPFDAEDWKYTAWPRCRKLEVHLLARVTGPNSILRPGQEWSARPHFGVRLWTWPDLEKTSDLPPSEKRATDYVPFADREVWAQRVSDAYSEWRGDRDLGYLLAHGEVVAAFGFDAAQLAADVDRLFAFRQERDELGHRISNCSKHPDFPDRCRVRKVVANDFIRRATTEANAVYQSYALHAAECGVQWGAGFDSWQGFIAGHGWTGWLSSHPNGCEQ